MQYATPLPSTHRTIKQYFFCSIKLSEIARHHQLTNHKKGFFSDFIENIKILVKAIFFKFEHKQNRINSELMHY